MKSIKGIVKGLVLGILISFLILIFIDLATAQDNQFQLQVQIQSFTWYAQAKMPRDLQLLTVRNMQVGESGFCKVKSIVVNEKGLTFLEASAEIFKVERTGELTSEYVKVTKEADGFVVTILKPPSRGWVSEHIYNEKDRIDRGDLISVKSILKAFNQ